jgi:hypothetical protein
LRSSMPAFNTLHLHRNGEVLWIQIRKNVAVVLVLLNPQLVIYVITFESFCRKYAIFLRHWCAKFWV